MPFNELKIDERFVTGMDKDQQKETIVRACVALARELGLSCCATGVNSKAVFEMLAHLQCEAFQGDFISKPLRATEIPGLCEPL